MQDQDKPQKNTEIEELGDAYGQDNGTGRVEQRSDNSGSDNLNQDRKNGGDDKAPKSNTGDMDDPYKYLAMEQQGVEYTRDADPTVNSDQMDFNEESQKNEWNSEGGNSLNSDAFNQDDYMLEDNVDLDEDQNQSISTDDEDFEESNERYTN